MKNDNIYVVYMHVNKINDKKYVGVTCRKPEYRWNYGKGYWQNKHFYNAINKYGWDNFEHLILFSNLTHDEACEKERELIEYYNSNNQKYGYNNTSGGDVNFALSEEAKIKISEANKGEKNANYGISPKDRMDADTYKQWLYKQQTNKPHGQDNPQYGVSPKERMSEDVYQRWLIKRKENAPKGGNHPMYGVSTRERMDEDTYQKWLKKHRESSRNIAVQCVETKKQYKSAREAERETGIGHSSILKSCNSEDYSIIAGGLHWCYVGDNIPDWLLNMEYCGKRYVKCIETGKIYPTARDAKKDLGCDDSAINKCCKGKVKTVCGYHWEYVFMLPDQYNELCKTGNYIDKSLSN